jgi:transposase
MQLRSPRRRFVQIQSTSPPKPDRLVVACVKCLCPFGKLHMDIVRHSDDAKRFQLVRKRWTAERTTTWLDKARRRSRD